MADSWKDVVQLLGLAGAGLYGLGWIFVARFFERVGVSPEEVGVDWLWVLVRVGIAALVVAPAVAVVTWLIRSLGVQISGTAIAVEGWPALIVLVPLGVIFAFSGLASPVLWVALALFWFAAMSLAPGLAMRGAPASGADEGAGSAARLPPPRRRKPPPRTAPPTADSPADAPSAGPWFLGGLILIMLASVMLTWSLATAWGNRLAEGKSVSVTILPGVPAMQVARVELLGRAGGFDRPRQCTMFLGRADDVIVVLAFRGSEADGVVWRLDESGVNLRSLPGSCRRDDGDDSN